MFVNFYFIFEQRKNKMFKIKNNDNNKDADNDNHFFLCSLFFSRFSKEKENDHHYFVDDHHTNEYN